MRVAKGYTLALARSTVHLIKPDIASWTFLRSEPTILQIPNEARYRTNRQGETGLASKNFRSAYTFHATDRETGLPKPPKTL